MNRNQTLSGGTAGGACRDGGGGCKGKRKLLGKCLFSGKEKAHKHKQFCPVTAWVRGGGLPTGWPGVKCLCAVCGTERT